MKKRYVNLILAMASASVLVLGSVPAMAKTDETKTESGEEAETSGEKDTDADQLPEIVLNLADGKTFTIIAEGLSKEHK